MPYEKNLKPCELRSDTWTPLLIDSIRELPGEFSERMHEPQARQLRGNLSKLSVAEIEQEKGYPMMPY